MVSEDLISDTSASQACIRVTHPCHPPVSWFWLRWYNHHISNYPAWLSTTKQSEFEEVSDPKLVVPSSFISEIVFSVLIFSFRTQRMWLPNDYRDFVRFVSAAIRKEGGRDG